MKDKKWIHDLLDDQSLDHNLNDLLEDKTDQGISPELRAKYEGVFNAIEARKLIDSRLKPAIENKVRVISFGARLLKYAAVLMMIGFAFYLLLQKKATDLNQVKVSRANSGSKKPMLILENGERVDLASLNNTKLSANLIKGDNQLDYSHTDNLVQSPIFNTLIIPRGLTYKLVLDDGTQVWVNADSRIKFQVNFDATAKREVYLEKGEAYFTVTKNPKKPFIVHYNGVNVTVLGTSFNINTYSSIVQTTLVEGKVDVSLADGSKQLILLPGEQANFHKSTEGLEKKDVEVFPYVAWKEGLVVFQNTEMANLMEELGRLYDYEIVFKDEKLKHLHFTGRADQSEPIQNTLDAIQITSNLKFTIKERSIIVEKSTKK